MGSYGKLLVDQKARIGVWGAGFIGLSTLAHFGRQGVKGVAVDIDQDKVDAVNRGEVKEVGMLEWLGFPIEPLASQGTIRATVDHRELLAPDVIAHFIAIPTEKDGEPYYAALENVIAKLTELKVGSRPVPPLVIIESTLTPGTTDEKVVPMFRDAGIEVGTDILLGIAPRRDWFVDDTKALTDLDRVFGGYDAATSDAMQDVIGIVCKVLHRASDHRVAEMVKSFENSYRHVEITLANQLSLAYPDVNIREALRLVGTKWNIGTFYPGFGTGGYCIPLSSRYVMAGARRPDALSIVKGTIATDDDINLKIAQNLVDRGYKRVGVLGLSYKANLKVSILSPTIPFVRRLKEAGVDVSLNDPLFPADEISRELGVPTFGFPEELSGFDAVVLVVGHDAYRRETDELFKHLEGCRYVLDNAAVWECHKDRFASMGIEYHVSGDENWLS